MQSFIRIRRKARGAYAYLSIHPLAMACTFYGQIKLKRGNKTKKNDATKILTYFIELIGT